MACGRLEKFIGASAVLLGVALPRATWAEEKARLVYVRGEGADDCPAEVDLRLWVMARLGYDPFSPQASRVVIARVESREHELRGNVEVADQQGLSMGRRELSSKSERCQELARAMALSISLAIDPERANAPRPKPNGPPPEQEVEAKAMTKGEPAAESALTPDLPPQRSRVSTTYWFATMGFSGSLGALPAAALGGWIGAGVRARSLSLALESRALQSFGRELEPRGTLSGSLLGGGLSGCLHADPVGLCLVGYAALQRLSARGVSAPSGSSGLYFGVGPRVGVDVPVGRQFALSLGLEGLLNLSRNTARLTDLRVWQAPVFNGFFGIGGRASFL